MKNIRNSTRRDVKLAIRLSVFLLLLAIPIAGGVVYLVNAQSSSETLKDSTSQDAALFASDQPGTAAVPAYRGEIEPPPYGLARLDPKSLQVLSVDGNTERAAALNTPELINQRIQFIPLVLNPVTPDEVVARATPEELAAIDQILRPKPVSASGPSEAEE